MCEYRFGEILLFVVNCQIGAQLSTTRDLGVGAGGDKHFATCFAAELDCRGADAGSAAVD